MNISEKIRESISVKEKILNDTTLLSKVEEAAKLWVETFKSGGKVLFCGNGGSAADAQHLSAELSGRFYKDRAPLYAEALHVNSSYITAVSNDYSYEKVYERMVEACGKSADVLVAISTSGNSKNIVLAAEKAKSLGMKVIAYTGESGGMLSGIADVLINIPSSDTPRIQESHILVGHIMCEYTENELF